MMRGNEAQAAEPATEASTDDMDDEDFGGDDF